MSLVDTLETESDDILRLGQVDISELSKLLSRYNLALNITEQNKDIPGSFWGDDEAGLIANHIYARHDTPVHSLLHESCHYICMDQLRRESLNTNAGGTADEENAVCYLQILLSKELSFMNPAKMMQDMDSWGYNFRLGSCAAWFEQDTKDELQWLLNHGLINMNNTPTFALRK
jgi:hypothetical protein